MKLFQIRLVSEEFRAKNGNGQILLRASRYASFCAFSLHVGYVSRVKNKRLIQARGERATDPCRSVIGPYREIYPDPIIYTV